MKIQFILEYNTHWGEILYICGDVLPLGAGDLYEAVEMHHSGNGRWTAEIYFDAIHSNVNYFFLVKENDQVKRLEWGMPHSLVGLTNESDAVVIDSWQEMPKDYPFYSSAFVNGIWFREKKDKLGCPAPGFLHIVAEAPRVEPNEYVAVAGKGDLLGNWNPEESLRMNDSNYPEWTVNLPLEALDSHFEYKFVIRKKSDGSLVRWEDFNGNRHIDLTGFDNGMAVVVKGVRFENADLKWKGAGTAIPVFSIRSEEDFGVGDFFDLLKMVDWCASTGQNILQILPINDTTKHMSWKDSYPYSANSSFALHPMFLRPEAVGRIDDPIKCEHFKNAAQELNALPTVDYEAVNKIKDEYFHEIFNLYGESDLASETFRTFFSKNEGWLVPYAAWRVLTDEFGTPDNSEWGEYSVFDYEKVIEFSKSHAESVRYHYFLQYHLDKQLSAVRDYAHKNGVVIKGDVPIGIGRFSADAWQHPHFFNMNSQAGAPPDDFSRLGQNWGFPTYNWNQMALDGYQWWKDRFRKMADYFDAYRIDHILGFFRIWEIPLDAVHGLLGYFNPALPFSSEELKADYDFEICPELQTRPLALDWVVDGIFGEYSNEVKKIYLEPISDGSYRFAGFVDTQRKIEKYFSTIESTEKENRIRNGLMQLAEDVLFIEDPIERNHFYPRIDAFSTYQYKYLSDKDKNNFNRLYNDFFYLRNNDFWEKKAMEKLPPLLLSTKMLACGEDLGMIPTCVPEVMEDLEILSLEIERMPKEYGVEFGDTERYPYYSVCTTSTHDMDGIRSWWSSDQSMARRYSNSILGKYGEVAMNADAGICRSIIQRQLESGSMLCILPLADWLSADESLRRENAAEERINVPAVSQYYWRYRMHLTVEDLINNANFNFAMRNALLKSERYHDKG